MSLTAIAILFISQLATEASQPKSLPSYVVRVSVREKYTGQARKPGVVLAEPNLAVVAGREASFHTGGATTVGSEEVPSGTMAKLKIDPAQNNEVRVTGVIDIANLATPEEGVVLRESKSIHFVKTIPCGKTTRIRISKSTESECWLDLQVDHAEQQAARTNRIAK